MFVGSRTEIQAIWKLRPMTQLRLLGLSGDLFRGQAQCNECHRDGGPGEDPLFTDFTASNIGTPANPRLPYYGEDRPDALGYVAGIVIRRWGCRHFSQQRTSTQPALGGRCAMAQAGAGQPGANSGTDTAQRRQTALSGLREGLRA